MPKKHFVYTLASRDDFKIAVGLYGDTEALAVDDEHVIVKSKVVRQTIQRYTRLYVSDAACVRVREAAALLLYGCVGVGADVGVDVSGCVGVWVRVQMRMLQSKIILSRVAADRNSCGRQWVCSLLGGDIGAF